MKKSEPIRLDQLTSLRFFAAAMIVVFHSSDLFGLGNTCKYPFPLEQGISFFFVLSGFILAFVYPKLGTWTEVGQFLRARIARLWPAHFASFMFAFWLLSLDWNNRTALANLLMIQAWIPLPNYFFSYNAPSWSISTEFFFYLVFPFLIYQWENTWRAKLFVAGVLVVLLITLSNLWQLPSYNFSYQGVTNKFLISINPASRLFEFTFGIFLAFLWSKNKGRIQWSPASATAYELLALLFCGLSMYYMVSLSGWAAKDGPGNATAVWLRSSGSVFAFGLLIYVVALGRGKVSALLSRPALVLLGEISFSIYLLHQILLRYYQSNISAFSHLPNMLALSLYWSILILLSYLIWVSIEMPGRRLILGQIKPHGSSVMQKNWHDHLALNSKTLLVLLVLLSLVLPLYFSAGIHRISSAEANSLTPAIHRPISGTHFGELFILRGLNITRSLDGLYVDLAWESMAEQDLQYTNGIHLTDVNGAILTQADYRQSLRSERVKSGDVWKDSIFIPADRLTGKEKILAIALYETPIGLLSVDRGERDWDNHRLRIPLEYGEELTANEFESRRADTGGRGDHQIAE